MAITKTPRLDQTRWSSGQDLVKREDFDNDAAELESAAAIYLEGPLSSRPAAGTHGVFYTVVGDSTAANNGRQYYDNGVAWAAPSYSNNQVSESLVAGDTALTARAVAAPTANIFAVQDSTKANHFVVTKDGYATTQRTVGSSGGVQLGYASTHNQAGLFISVAATKPINVLKGALNQSGNFLEFRTSTNALVTQFTPGGGAIFGGPITATNITATGTLTVPTITTSGATNLIDATVTSGAQSHVGLTVKAITNQSNNLIEIYNASGTRTAKFVHDGTFATNGRIMAGTNGNSGSQSFTTNTAMLTLKNIIDPTTPLLNLYANVSSQTGKVMQVFDSANNLTFWVDSAGNASATNNIDSESASIGAGSNTSPTPYFNSFTPKFEVVTGTVSDTYSEGVTLRHANKSTAAVTRRVSMRMKLSDESNQTESNKWAGIAAHSTLANAASPNLILYAASQEAGRFDGATLNFSVNGNLNLNTAGSYAQFASGAADKLYMTTSGTDYGVIGLQTAKTMFMRSDNIALYSGGSFNSVGMNSGGGAAMALFSNDRTTLQKLTLSNTTAYDSTAPVFSIGAGDTHMQFSNLSINAYAKANNSQTAELNLQNNGGNLRLGNTSTTVSLPSRIIWVGNIDDVGAANAILFARSSAGSFHQWVGRDAQNGDWWFDHTDNVIKVHDGDHFHTFTPSSN